MDVQIPLCIGLWTLQGNSWEGPGRVPRFESEFLPLSGHLRVLGVEIPLPWASSRLNAAPDGVVSLVHLHPDPVDGVVGPMDPLLDHVLIGALQRQLGTEPVDIRNPPLNLWSYVWQTQQTSTQSIKIQ